jgi:hypothetical protein
MILINENTAETGGFEENIVYAISELLIHRRFRESL